MPQPRVAWKTNLNRTAKRRGKRSWVFESDGARKSFLGFGSSLRVYGLGGARSSTITYHGTTSSVTIATFLSSPQVDVDPNLMTID